MSRVVVSLHGIRTRGVWQKELAPILSKAGFIPYPLDYEYFSTFKFLRSKPRDHAVENLRKTLENIRNQENVRRVSIIAHSFGTYMTAALIEKHHWFRFDKVIFAGAIVRQDFAWGEVFNRCQVNLVRNDYGLLDIWPNIAQKFVRDAGASGSEKFAATNDPRLIQESFPKHKHSDYFCEAHFREYWIPTLRMILLHDEDRTEIIQCLSVMVQDTARMLRIDERLLRANIFTENQNGKLSIQSGLQVNMTDPNELRLELSLGEGCTGNAFLKRRTEITRFVDGNWTGTAIVGQIARQKINNRLRWVISTPIVDPDLYGPILGTMSIDCLDQEKTQEELEALRELLHSYAENLAHLMKQRI